MTVPTVVNVAQNDTPNTGSVITKYAGLAANDVQLAWKIVDNTADTFSISGTGQATWTQLAGSPASTSIDGQELAVFIQRAGASEPASYSLDSSNSGIGGIITIRGVDATTALDVAVTVALSNSANASPWNIDAAGLTTVTGDSLLVMIAGDDVTSSAAVTHTAPASPGTWTKQTEGNSGFLNYGVFTAPKPAAGATGTVTAVGTAGGASAGWATFLIALRTATPPANSDFPPVPASPFWPSNMAANIAR